MHHAQSIIWSQKESTLSVHVFSKAQTAQRENCWSKVIAGDELVSPMAACTTSIAPSHW